VYRLPRSTSSRQRWLLPRALAARQVVQTVHALARPSRGAVLAGGSWSVRAWAVALTRAVGWGLEAVAHALEVARPAIVHRAKGAQGPQRACTGGRAAAEFQRRRAGRGRALAHGVVARRWRAVPEAEGEEKEAETPREAPQGVGPVVGRGTAWRPPQALGSQTPASLDGGSYVEQSLVILALLWLDDGVRLTVRFTISTSYRKEVERHVKTAQHLGHLREVKYLLAILAVVDGQSFAQVALVVRTHHGQSPLSAARRN
jgi:hypothetical protein